MNNTTKDEELLKNAIEVLNTPSSYAAYLPEFKAMLCVVKKNFITKKDFETLFNAIGEAAKINKAEKVIFDKRNMEVFDQEGMTWYHIVWKEELLSSIGLKKHRKLLPNDDFFKTSVELGKEKIAREHNFDFSRFDIQYFDDLSEALKA